MQSALCLERIRLGRKLALLVGFVAWSAIGLIAASAPCVAQSATESAGRLNGAQSKTAVYIVEETECKTLGRDPRDAQARLIRRQAPPGSEQTAAPPWSHTEHWAWNQICNHLNVDFDEKQANEFADQKAAKGSPERAKRYQERLEELRGENPEKLATDESRRLSSDFLAMIFGNEALRHHTWNEPLKFFGFSTDRLVIDTATLQSLDIRNAHVGELLIQNTTINGGLRLENVRTDRLVIDTAALQSLDIRNAYVGEFLIQNTTINGGLRLENVRLASTKVHLVTAKHFLLNNVSVAATNFGLVHVSALQPPFKREERDGALNIDTARFEDRLTILEGDYDAIKLKHVKVGDLFIQHPVWNRCRESGKPELSISESVDNGVFTLEVDRTGVLPNETKLNQLTLEVNDKRNLPTQIKLNQFIFANAYLGRDPMPVISAMDADAGIPTSGRPDLEPYTLIAKSYAVRGETSISDRVLIAKDNQDWHLTNSMLEFVWLTFTYFVAVYGFHPELGFAWIAAFVALGWLIFRYASGRLAVGSYKPRSPLLLALDSVIPGIQLDKNHQDVRYDGWPQIMLYLLRILGAVLVFVAFSYLQKKLLG